MSADNLYKQKKIRGFCHLSTGQEAVAVGIEHAITRDDPLITAYRSHGFTLMRGGTPRSILGELLGRQDGISYGKGGSMHMFCPNFFGGNGIVGAHVPVGTGIAFAQKFSEKNNVTLDIYGDGAANQGQVHESFNMAKLWDLPVIYGCESKSASEFMPLRFSRYTADNKYGMGTSAERASAMTEYYKRGQYIPGLRIDAMDVLAVLSAVRYGKEYVRAGNGPLLYEYATYRYAGHSMSDPGIQYRSREELKEQRANDPLSNFKTRLIEWEILSEDEARDLDKQVRNEINHEVEVAENMPEPPNNFDTLFQDIYVRGSEPRQRRGRTVDESINSSG